MKRLNIRHERINRGWSLEFVAQQLGITNQAVNLIETAQRDPSYKVLCKIEKLFGKDHRYLLAQIAEPQSAPDSGGQMWR